MRSNVRNDLDVLKGCTLQEQTWQASGTMPVTYLCTYPNF